MSWSTIKRNVTGGMLGITAVDSVGMTLMSSQSSQCLTIAAYRHAPMGK
jgi:hypothetical protein